MLLSYILAASSLGTKPSFRRSSCHPRSVKGRGVVAHACGKGGGEIPGRVRVGVLAKS